MVHAVSLEFLFQECLSRADLGLHQIRGRQVELARDLADEVLLLARELGVGESDPPARRSP